ncbi:MAG: DNA translocase FtsK [Anaerolineaceae bacterium]|nr:DNA translocase FtsK [Anaerolineaceae bacterium]
MATRSTKKTTSRKTAKKRKSPGASPVLSAISSAFATMLERIHQLSPDQRLDILGGFSVLVGVLSLVGIFLQESSVVSQQWIKFLSFLTGWTAFGLPVLLILLGLWLILRRIDQLPPLSFERALGVFLLYFNLLIWLHLFSNGTWDSARAGDGGGLLGALFAMPMRNLLGFIGALCFNTLWLWYAVMFIFNLPFARIWEWMKPVREQLRERFQTHTVPVYAGDRISKKEEIEIPEDLPTVFKPISEIENSKKPKRGKKKADEPEQKPAAVETEAFQDELDFLESPVSPPPDLQWNLPEVDHILLPAPEFQENDEQAEARARTIEETLDLLGAPGHVVEINRGPRVTQFGVEPDFSEKRGGDRVRVRVTKVLSLADDLTMALASQSVRIQAPVPGKSYIGIEVPNDIDQPVMLSELIESQAFRDIHSPLKFALGKDVTGSPIAANLKTMPHLLIAGTTGAGKSVCVNAILCNFLLNNSPRDLRLVLVDPKRVELAGYNGIPHLLAPVVVDMSKVVNALQWILREMESRYHKFSKIGARNLVGYNRKKPEDYMPHIVVVIDELADLMMTAPGETETAITRLAQLARATGIHLILATQRPSVKVITGVIKANFPARIAFNVATGIDSRVILDQNGAERLLGRGDMLFKPPDSASAIRLQGAYVSDQEIEAIVDYWQFHALKDKETAQSDNGADLQPKVKREPVSDASMKQQTLWDLDSKQDPLLEEALELVRSEGRASTTMLQRRLRIGYTRAARMIDTMESMEIIGPPHPTTQVRDILDYGPMGPPKEEDD